MALSSIKMTHSVKLESLLVRVLDAGRAPGKFSFRLPTNGKSFVVMECQQHSLYNEDGNVVLKLNVFKACLTGNTTTFWCIPIESGNSSDLLDLGDGSITFKFNEHVLGKLKDVFDFNIFPCAMPEQRFIHSASFTKRMELFRKFSHRAVHYEFVKSNLFKYPHGKTLLLFVAVALNYEVGGVLKMSWFLPINNGFGNHLIHLTDDRVIDLDDDGLLETMRNHTPVGLML